MTDSTLYVLNGPPSSLVFYQHVELVSSPGDEGSLSMLKKAVTCPSVLAPGAPGVSNGDCWDCLVSPCFIIDLPVHTRTPDVTDPIAPLTGSREALTGRYGLRF